MGVFRESDELYLALKPFVEMKLVDKLSSEWNYYCEGDLEENPYEIEGTLIDYSSLNGIDKERMQVDFEILMERFTNTSKYTWPKDEKEFEELAKERLGL